MSTRLQLRPELYTLILKIWGIGMIVVAVAAIIILFFLEIETDTFRVNLGGVILNLQALWIALSIRYLRVDEAGLILFWGTALKEVRRGLRLVPAGLCQLERVSTAAQQDQFPADPELIQKTDDEVPLEQVTIERDGQRMTVSKVRPIRITTAAPKDIHKGQILNVQMTTEWTFWVLWRIKGTLAFILNAQGDMDVVRKQMRDSGESCLVNEVKERVPLELISEFDKIQEELQKGIATAVKRWGIEILAVGMTAPDLNHEVAKALRNIPIVRAEAEQTRTTADATAYKIAKEGEGTAEARRLLLAKEGIGLEEAARAAGLTTEQYLQALVARETIGEGDVILGAEGIAQAFGLLRGATNPPSNQGGGTGGTGNA